MSHRHQILASKYKSESDSAVDLTPLTDIIFIMLIFFIVTATFIKETGVDLFKPPSLKIETADEKNVTIRINNADQIMVNGQVITPESLSSRITQEKAANPDIGVAILVAPESTANTLVQAIDAARRAGFGAVPVSELKE